MTPAVPDIDALWNFADPAASETRFVAATGALHAESPGWHGLLLRTQVARAQGLQRRFADAHRTLDAIDVNAPGAPPMLRVRHLLERGRVFNSSGDRASAKPCFAEAWDVASRSALDGLAVDAAHMIAIVESGNAVMEWNVKALALAESSGDPAARKWRGSLLNNIGWTHFAAGRHGEALDLFERAVVARTEAGETGRLLVARWCVARTLRALGRIADALALQQSLSAAHEAAGTTDGYVCEELAECLLESGRGTEAASWFAKAHALLSRDAWLAESEPARLERIRSLSLESAAG